MSQLLGTQCLIDYGAPCVFEVPEAQSLGWTPGCSEVPGTIAGLQTKQPGYNLRSSFASKKEDTLIPAALFIPMALSHACPQEFCPNVWTFTNGRRRGREVGDTSIEGCIGCR